MNNKIKRAVSWATGAAVCLGGGFLISKLDMNETGAPIDSIHCVIMDTIRPVKDDGDQTYSLMNIGDHIQKGKSSPKKITKAIKNGNAVGIIINSTAGNKADIYLDVDFVKQVLDEYEVTCPVFFDITNLVNNNDLDPKQTYELVLTFCSKCTSNGMYVGIAGKEADLKKLFSCDETHSFVSYDVLLLDNDPSLDVNNEYGVTSSIETSEDNEYTTNMDYPSIMINKVKNNSSAFAYDYVHIVEESDILSDLAYKYGMSIRDILKYNGIKEKDFKVGMKLVIPSKIVSAKVPLDNGDSELVYGLDISSYQSNIDWNFIKSNYSFIVLRSSVGQYEKDNKFISNREKCIMEDIPFATYSTDYVSYDDPDFEGSVRRTAKNYIDLMLDSATPLVSYLDLEDWEHSGHYITSYTKDQIKFTLDCWYEMMTSNGFVPGIYCNQSTFKIIYNAIDNSEDISRFKIYIAGDLGDKVQYGSEAKEYEQPISLDEVISAGIVSSDLVCSSYPVDIWQVTCNGKDAGAANGNGYADIDVAKYESMFGDSLEKDKEEKGVQSYQNQKFTQHTSFGARLQQQNAGQNASLVALGAAMGVGGAVAVGRKANQVYTSKQTRARRKKYY